MKRLTAWSVLLIAFGAGCATTPPRSTVDAYFAGGHGGHTSRDVAHCEAWAKLRTGYDPVSETVTGLAGGAYTYSQSKKGYDRAYAACMAARPPALAPMPAALAPAPMPVTVQPASVIVAPAPLAMQPIPVAVAPVVMVEPRGVHVPPGD